MSDKPKPSPDDNNAVIVTTRRQRGFWVHLLNQKNRESGNHPLKLSNWIIRHLPNPETDPRAKKSNKGS